MLYFSNTTIIIFIQIDKPPEDLNIRESFIIPVNNLVSPFSCPTLPSSNSNSSAEPVKSASTPAPTITSIQPCLALSSGPEDTLLVVDMLRCEVRELDLAAQPVVKCRTVFRSVKLNDHRVFLRGAVFVPRNPHSSANYGASDGTLVVFEMEPKWEWDAMVHRVLVCSYNRPYLSFTSQTLCTQHFPRVLRFESFLNTGVLRIGRRQLLLANLNSTSELEVFDFVSPNNAVALHALRLGFTQFCFTAATVSEAPLLFAAELHTPAVRVLLVHGTNGSLQTQLLRRLPIDCQRIIWNDTLGLLCAMRDDKRYGMLIQVWKMSTAETLYQTESFTDNSCNNFKGWTKKSLNFERLDCKFGVNLMFASWSCIRNKVAIYVKNDMIIKIIDFVL